ncbi:MAG: hypothetical protein N2235_16670 [Fischerella sp.]|nr:hypothetical protein [Fischerella sp.]
MMQDVASAKTVDQTRTPQVFGQGNFASLHWIHTLIQQRPVFRYVWRSLPFRKDLVSTIFDICCYEYYHPSALTHLPKSDRVLFLFSLSSPSFPFPLSAR